MLHTWLIVRADPARTARARPRFSYVGVESGQNQGANPAQVSAGAICLAPRRSGALELDPDDVDLECIDVLEGVRRQRAAPDRSARLWERAAVACVDQNRPVGVPAHEVAEGKDVEDAGPTMRVELRRLAGGDASFQDADSIVLEEETV